MFGSDAIIPTNKLLTGRVSVLGRSGSGKSNSAAVIAEELCKQGRPFLYVDPESEAVGIKEHYEAVHIGADKNSDVKISKEMVPRIVDVVLQHEVPVVFETSGFLTQEQERDYVAEIAEEFFIQEAEYNKPCPIILEESAEYIPQRRGRDRAGDIIHRVARRGRARGLGLIGISQRPADIDKGFITQCNILIVHQLKWGNDTKAIRDVLGRESADQVQQLGVGEALVYTGWNNRTVQVKFRRRETWDAGATPGSEDYVEKPPPLTPVRPEILQYLRDG